MEKSVADPIGTEFPARNHAFLLFDTVFNRLTGRLARRSRNAGGHPFFSRQFTAIQFGLSSEPLIMVGPEGLPPFSLDCSTLSVMMDPPPY
jgi:hypothetical protein